MDKKKKYIIGITVVFLAVLLVYFKANDGEIIDVTDEIISEERRQELEEIKDKDFYEDSLLVHLGWTEKEIVNKYGEPNDVRPHYLEGKEFYYEDLSAAFIFSGSERVVNNLYLYPGAEALGVRVGMTFNEIEDVLGQPRYRGLDSSYEDERYIMNYFLGEQTEGGGQLELWIDAREAEGASQKIDVLWKKYWENI